MASSIIKTDLSIKIVVECGSHRSEVEVFKDKITIQAKVVEMKNNG